MKYRVSWASEAVRIGLRWLVPSGRQLRLFVYFSGVSLLGLLLAGRALYAATREDAFGVGHALLGLADLTEGAETVQLNGERFHHAVTATQQPLHTVLDRIEEHCRKNPGAAALVLGELASNDPKRFEQHAPPGTLRNAVFREEAATRGMVLCFVGAPNSTSTASWLASLKHFSATRDLSAFGRLRYSFAETAERGGTRVVTLWAETGLNLSALFPKTGDAPGFDSPLVARPPGARRTLSASAEGLPFSVHIYESNEGLDATQRFYDSWMSEHGYRATHAAELGAGSYLRSDGDQVFLSLLREGSHTFVTVTDSEQGNTSATVRLGGEP